jgi:hypothetical protein
MLFSLLTLPVRAPVKAGRWVIDQVLRAAEAEMSQGSVQERIAAVQAAYDRGEIDPDEVSARMDGLLDELLTGRESAGAGLT